MKRFAAALLLLISASIALFASRVDIICFNAGSADCFLITNGEHRIMIDTGLKKSGKDVAAYLEDNGIEQLDLMIITHFDKDHIGGAPQILKAVDVDRLVQSNFPKESKQYDEYIAALKKEGIVPETLRNDMRLKIGDMDIILDAPAMEEYPVDPSNNSSLITTILVDGSSLLFMGDAETMRLQEFYRSCNRTYDLVKIPHHGRSDMALEGVIDRIRPKYAVITSSIKELEDVSVMDMLSEKNIETYLTRMGEVEITLIDGEFSISQK